MGSAARILPALELRPWRSNIHSDKVGIYVQLEIGRTYILKNTLSFRETIKLQVSAFVSRLTIGRFALGMPIRPRLPYNPRRS